MKNNLNSFNELMDNPRIKALAKLSMWAIFFVVFFLVAKNENTGTNLNNNETNKTTTKETVTFSKMKDNLFNNSLNIKYIVRESNGEESVFEGTIDNNELTAIVETSKSLIKIKVINDKIHEVKMGENIENDQLLKLIKPSYLIPSKLFLNFDDATPVIKKEEKYKVYTYEVEESIYEVYIDELKIFKIIIQEEETTYELEYYS